jgi:hypothetical protein
MSETTTTTIARLRGLGWSPAKILSGLGHPGYGQKFARQAIERMESFGLTPHEAIYGGREATVKVWGL